MIALIFLISACSTTHKDGEHTETYPSGKKKSQGLYKDGKPDGTWTFWSKSGEVITISEYKAGNLVGEMRYWPERIEKNDEPNQKVFSYFISILGEPFSSRVGGGFSADFLENVRLGVGFGLPRTVASGVVLGSLITFTIKRSSLSPLVGLGYSYSYRSWTDGSDSAWFGSLQAGLEYRLSRLSFSIGINGGLGSDAPYLPFFRMGTYF